MSYLDCADRAHDLRQLILKKPALRLLYTKFYQRYVDCLERCPQTGLIVEIGSGAGFSKHIIPEIITTDILPYATVDICGDSMQMPFKDGSLRAIFMLNTLHHIPNVKRFFREARRCLRPNGRVLIVDQYLGWLSYWIFKFAHHEPFNPKTKTWAFNTTGPLSGANGALCWIIFYRDRKRFEQLFPDLCIHSITPHSPLCYWLAGGLKSWSLLPGSLFHLVSTLDDAMSRVVPPLSSFVDVELVRT